MKLYIYDHCPFCLKARMIFGLKNLPVELVTLLNDDEAASAMPDPAIAAYTVVTVLKANLNVVSLMTVSATNLIQRDGQANQRQILINTQYGSVGVAHNRSGFEEAILGTPANTVDLSKTILLMTTYSAGIARVFVNDAEVAAGPLAYINPRGSLIGAAGDNVRQYRGLIGETLEFSTDYSTPSLVGGRARLVAYLKGKYGIV